MSLFSPFQLGPLLVPNRFVMAPMTRCRAIGNLPNELMREYYTQRASAGLIVTEGVSPSPNGLGYPRIPGIFSEEQVAGWRAVTSSVHDAGGRIFVQLMHCGRIAHPLNLPAGGRVVAPSAVRADGLIWTDTDGQKPHPEPEVLSEADIAGVIGEFVQAVKNAREAGFDGVELHSANGYLLEQFLHPHTNRRSDAYGGSIQKRTRFVVEVARATSEAIGSDRVGIRLSPYSTFNDLPEHDAVGEQYLALVEQLRGLAYLHLVGQNHPGYSATARRLQQAFGGPVIVCGGFERESAEAALREGRADLVAFGKPFISNPDLVQRVRRAAPLAPPVLDTFFKPGPQGYTDYPAL